MHTTPSMPSDLGEFRPLAAHEVEDISGGFPWFPVIFALARFGLSRASHNGSSGTSADVPVIDLPPSSEEVGIRTSSA